MRSTVFGFAVFSEYCFLAFSPYFQVEYTLTDFSKTYDSELNTIFNQKLIRRKLRMLSGLILGMRDDFHILPVSGIT